GVRPLRLAGPVALFAAALGIALFWLGEKVVVRADARAEEIQVRRFNKWGDWATYHAGSSWIRGKQGRIYHLGQERDGGWEPATRATPGWRRGPGSPSRGPRPRSPPWGCRCIYDAGGGACPLPAPSHWGRRLPCFSGRSPWSPTPPRWAALFPRSLPAPFPR